MSPTSLWMDSRISLYSSANSRLVPTKFVALSLHILRGNPRRRRQLACRLQMDGPRREADEKCDAGFAHFAATTLIDYRNDGANLFPRW